MKPIQMTYPTTGVEETTLRLIGEKFSSTPENYKIHGGRGMIAYYGCFVFVFVFVLFFVLFCFVLFCFVLFCFVFCFVLFCFVLFCFVLFCFVLFLFVCLFLYMESFRFEYEVVYLHWS